MKHTIGWIIYTKSIFRPNAAQHWLVWDEAQAHPEALWMAAQAAAKKGPEYEVKVVKGPIYF